MNYNEKFIPFSKDNVEEIQDIIQAAFPDTQVVVVQMQAPVLNYLNHIVMAKTVRYDPLYGVFEAIQNDIIKLKWFINNNKFNLEFILIGLYGYYPNSSIIRYGIKTM